jgi:hypothetical protein
LAWHALTSLQDALLCSALLGETRRDGARRCGVRARCHAMPCHAMPNRLAWSCMETRRWEFSWTRASLGSSQERIRPHGACIKYEACRRLWQTSGSGRTRRSRFLSGQNRGPKVRFGAAGCCRQACLPRYLRGADVRCRSVVRNTVRFFSLLRGLFMGGCG